ncbi:hypothetical protein AVEN_161834-1 [Araneus ventricosus]|uniref:Uncharacterized protein n=1 Tax=Araneus ventricosus TaxID=182803 RepID=A0A4Y2JRG9_ARAVE|nr:hypothetical protein AVEN_161834-1 [Araneus ventricosus]
MLKSLEIFVDHRHRINEDRKNRWSHVSTIFARSVRRQDSSKTREGEAENRKQVSQPFSMKCPSGVPWCMATTWSTTYVVEKCDVMWKLPHPVLTGGSEKQLRKLTFGIDLSNYNVG